MRASTSGLPQPEHVSAARIGLVTGLAVSLHGWRARGN
jgi:hypothetical protein